MNMYPLLIQRQFRPRFLAAGLLLTLTPAATHAAVVWQPAGASTTMASSFGLSPDHVINQSGLSASYTTGVTDFDTYVASNPTHNGGTTNNIWESNFVTMGNFDFDLGATVSLSAIIFWNDTAQGGSAFYVSGFNLFADDNPAFSSPTLLGSFTPSTNNGISASSVIPDVFTFAATEASYVRMQIMGSGGAVDVRFGEVAFGVVPEPSAALLTGLGALVLLRRRRHS